MTEEELYAQLQEITDRRLENGVEGIEDMNDWDRNFLLSLLYLRDNMPGGESGDVRNWTYIDDPSNFRLQSGNRRAFADYQQGLSLGNHNNEPGDYTYRYSYAPLGSPREDSGLSVGTIRLNSDVPNMYSRTAPSATLNGRMQDSELLPYQLEDTYGHEGQHALMEVLRMKGLLEDPNMSSSHIGGVDHPYIYDNSSLFWDALRSQHEDDPVRNSTFSQFADRRYRRGQRGANAVTHSTPLEDIEAAIQEFEKNMVEHYRLPPMQE